MDKQLKLTDSAIIDLLGGTAKVARIVSLAKGIINARDYDMRSALHLACAEGRDETVQYLIKNLCSLCCRMYSSVQMSFLSTQSFSIPR